MGYVLYNNASGGVCGPRLYKGIDDRDPRQRWPFYGIERWWEWDDLEQAEEAALRLQTYLVHRETGKTKKTK